MHCGAWVVGSLTVIQAWAGDVIERDKGSMNMVVRVAAKRRFAWHGD